MTTKQFERETVTDVAGTRAVGRKRCPVCGFKVRNWKDSKKCPSCSLTKPAQEWPHAAGRSGHLDSQCRSCKQARQRAGYRKEKAGDVNARAASLDFAPTQEGYLVGRFRGQVAAANLRSALGTVYKIRLGDVILNDGEQRETVDLVHAFQNVAETRFKRGEWLGAVFEGGYPVKLTRLDRPDDDALIDEALEVYPTPAGSETEFYPGSYSPVRPWLERFADHVFSNLPAAVDPFVWLSAIEDEILRNQIPELVEEGAVV